MHEIECLGMCGRQACVAGLCRSASAQSRSDVVALVVFFVTFVESRSDVVVRVVGSFAGSRSDFVVVA